MASLASAGLAIAVGAALSACPAPTDPPASIGTLMIGITAEDIGFSIKKLQVSAKIGAAEIHREEVTLLGPNGLSSGALPKAVKLESDKVGQMVDVEVKGITDDGQVLLTRLARAPMPSGDPRLLRVRL